MKQFRAIYRILRTLIQYNGDSDFDVKQIGADVVGLSEAEWEQIMIELLREGYIRGVGMTQSLSDAFPRIVYPIHPQITLKGMQYVEENSMMQKAMRAFKGISEVL